jgi:hypothetical protein
MLFLPSVRPVLGLWIPCTGPTGVNLDCRASFGDPAGPRNATHPPRRPTPVPGAEGRGTDGKRRYERYALPADLYLVALGLDVEEGDLERRLDERRARDLQHRPLDASRPHVHVPIDHDGRRLPPEQRSCDLLQVLKVVPIIRPAAETSLEKETAG